MMKNTSTSCVNLSDLDTDEKRKLWMERTGNTLKRLAEVAGVTSSALSRTLRRPTMPVAQHQTLVEFGVPQELLPRPFNQKPGPRPRRPVAEPSASLSA